MAVDVGSSAIRSLKERMKEFENGMNVVDVPTNQTGGSKAIVVFIHGLMGHPFKTWSGKKPSKECVFWPKDLLPTAVSGLNVYSWGYDADIEKFFRSTGQNTLHHHSTNLLNDLADLWDEINETSALKGLQSSSFVFVVHSLGGLVVKDALNKSDQANSETNHRHAEIIKNTAGVIFLGTPHRGSKSASLGKGAARLTEIVAAQRANIKLLQALEKNSEVQERVTDTFYQTLDNNRSLKICSFREEKEIRVLGVFSQIIVPSDVAKIGHVNEEVGSIPGDHRHIAKFACNSDTGFKRVSKVLKRFTDDISRGSDNDAYQDCLHSLNEPSARLRIQQVKREYQQSFQWLFDPKAVTFSEWLRNTGDTSNSSPIFWVTGRPGSGKSTLMKFALQHEETLRLLSTSTSPTWKLIGFFFHDRGSTIQKSAEGMIHEIVFQLLSAFPQLFTANIMEKFWFLARKQHTKFPIWSTEDLQELLMLCLNSPRKRTASSQNVCLFIDALDEHSGDQRELLELLDTIAGVGGPVDKSKTCQKLLNIKVCVASRPWPVFTKHLDRCPHFAIHEFTKPDIEKYTVGKITSVWSMELISDYDTLPTNVTTLVDLITAKANGVFIWVRLVVDEICSGIVDGSSFSELKKVLETMPTELGELYKRTLRKINRNFHEECVVLLKIATAITDNPLPLDVALQCTDAYIGKNGRVERQGLQTCKARLASRTGGLLEPVLIENPLRTVSTSISQGPLYAIQFLHQTVLEYVREEFCSSFSEEHPPGSWILLEAFVLLERVSGYPDLFLAYTLEYTVDVDTIIDNQCSELREAFQKLIYTWAIREFPEFDSMMHNYRRIFGDILQLSAVTPLILILAANIHNVDWLYTGFTTVLGPNTLIHCAAYGPRLQNSRIDWCRAVKNFLDLGEDPNPVWDITLPGSVVKLELTPLEALIILDYEKESNSEMRYPTESERLEVAELLLRNGALTTMGLRELCLRYRSPAWSALLWRFDVDGRFNSHLRSQVSYTFDDAYVDTFFHKVGYEDSGYEVDRSKRMLAMMGLFHTAIGRPLVSRDIPTGFLIHNKTVLSQNQKLRWSFNR